MKSGQTSEKAISHVGEYVDSRIAGANKQDSALIAGYSETTARKPSLIEATQAYAVVIGEVLTNNATMMRLVGQSLRVDAVTGAIDALKPLEKAQLYKIMAQVEQILTPKITIKETTDAKGNKTTTSWGSGSLQPSGN